MTNPIVKRCCILIEGELVSPLLAGSGQSEESDYDFICDAEGWPYVPGSTLAGVFRHYLLTIFGDGKRKAVEQLFGSTAGKSRLHCYHLQLIDPLLSRRDGVKLDQYKTAENQAKYTLQIVERDALFELRVEWIIRAESAQTETVEEELICELIDGIANGTLTIGAKGRRGFGELGLNQVSCSIFNHDAPDSSRKWLDWHWDNYDKQMKWEPGTSGLLTECRMKQLNPIAVQHELKVPLKIRNTIMIRQYTAKATQNGINHDYEQLKSAVGKNGCAIIPGTSWAGAIRHHLASMLEELGIEQEEAQRKLTLLFGSLIDGTKPNAKRNNLSVSRLRIAESVIEGGKELPTTRTAIDRFTGGVVSGSLFTSRPWVHGKTKLIIRWQDEAGELTKEAICGLLLWIIRDLQDGVLAVGGETAIGRGLLEACGEIELDGKSIEDQEQIYSQAALDWCKLSFQSVTEGERD